MSLFFFLSAYFLPASIEKKGIKQFLRERLYRLGLPIVIGFLTIIPILMYFYYVNFRGYPSISFFSYYINIYFGLGEMPPDWTGPSWPDMQFGHLWFLQHLLLYSLFAVIGQKLILRKPLKQFRVSVTPIFCLVITLTLVTFVVRIWHPIDSWVGFLGIIQTEFARVPQYVLFF